MTIHKDRAKQNSSIAVEKLRDLIFSGELGPGTDHLESELALSLGMSRTPVREALLVLQGQGLVEVRPRKGVRIVPLSPEDMGEIYEILTELESLAAANAASKNYSALELGDLSNAIELMDQALADSDLEAWAKADEQFHSELVRLGGNARLSQITNIMDDQVRRARMVTLYMRETPNASNIDHRKVFDAIARGDQETARQVHHAHRAKAKETLVELVKRHRLNSV